MSVRCVNELRLILLAVVSVKMRAEDWKRTGESEAEERMTVSSVRVPNNWRRKTGAAGEVDEEVGGERRKVILRIVEVCETVNAACVSNRVSFFEACVSSDERRE